MCSSNIRNPWNPDTTDAFHFSNKPPARDLCGLSSTVCQCHRRPIVRLVERGLQQVNVRSLECSKGRLEVRVSKSNYRWQLLPFVFGSWWSAYHVHHNNELNPCVCEPSVCRQSLIYSLQEAKVLLDDLVVLSDLKNV